MKRTSTVWDGFGNWVARTEIGAWAYPRRLLFEVGKLIAIGFTLLAKIPEIPGVKINYYNMAELGAIYALPLLVINSLVWIQPIITTLATLASSFYNNSWIFGIIGLFFPLWILKVSNIFLQHLYLAGWFFFIPLFSGGLKFMGKALSPKIK